MHWDEKVLEVTVWGLGMRATPCVSAVGSVSVVNLRVFATRVGIFPELCCTKCPADVPNRVVVLNTLSLRGRASQRHAATRCTPMLALQCLAKRVKLPPGSFGGARAPRVLATIIGCFPRVVFHKSVVPKCQET